MYAAYKRIKQPLTSRATFTGKIKTKLRTTDYDRFNCYNISRTKKIKNQDFERKMKKIKNQKTNKSKNNYFEKKINKGSLERKIEIDRNKVSDSIWKFGTAFKTRKKSFKKKDSRSKHNKNSFSFSKNPSTLKTSNNTFLQKRKIKTPMGAFKEKRNLFTSVNNKSVDFSSKKIEKEKKKEKHKRKEKIEKTEKSQIAKNNSDSFSFQGESFDLKILFETEEIVYNIFKAVEEEKDFYDMFRGYLDHIQDNDFNQFSKILSPSTPYKNCMILERLCFLVSFYILIEKRLKSEIDFLKKITSFVYFNCYTFLVEIIDYFSGSEILHVD